MPVTVIDLGKNNIVEASTTFLSKQNAVIRFSGSHNHVKIGQDNTADGALIRLGESCQFHSSDGNRLAKLSTFSIKNTMFSIGSGTGFTATCALYAHEAFNISIGTRCLIAGDTALSVSDMHSILSVETGERINPGGSITVGDHVWLGVACRIMRGVRIGADSVIEAGAIVTRDIPPNALATGVPAEVTRTGITWVQKLL